MKQTQRNIFILSTTIGSLFFLPACKNKAAIQALQELNSQTKAKIENNNSAISSAASTLNECKVAVAEVKKEPALVYELPRFEVPALSGAADDIKGLEAHKEALLSLAKQQEEKLNEVRMAGTTCASDLAAAKSAAELEASKVAVAQAEEATKKAATSVKSAVKKPITKVAKKVEDLKPEEKPVAVQKAEEAGTATKGVRSRYKARQ